jgi:hypothetical protein
MIGALELRAGQEDAGMAKKKNKKKARKAARSGTRKPRKGLGKSSKKKSSKKSRSTSRRPRAGAKKVARRPARRTVSKKSSPKKGSLVSSRPAAVEISGEPGWSGEYTEASQESPDSHRKIAHKTGGDSGSARPISRTDKTDGQEGETEW